jgi:heterodisulfide reductase subunit C
VANLRHNRGPLRAVILAKTGEDIRKCTHCWHCELERTEAMDLSFGDIIRAALQNDPKALENDTLWICDPVLKDRPVCPSGLNRLIVIQALREEAAQRGCKKDT